MKIKILYIVMFLVVVSFQTKTKVSHTLTYPTMVNIRPNSIVVGELVQKWGEDDYATIIDDVIWYESELMQLVDSLGMDQISSDQQHLELIGADKSWSIDMDTTENKWRYIYFDGNDFVEKDPISMKEYLIEHFKE